MVAAPGEHLPSSASDNLLVSRDGRLWIGTSSGLVSWKDGKLTQYPDLAGQRISSLLEDTQGTIWVGASRTPYGRLCTVRNTSVACQGQDGRFGYRVFSLYEYNQNLWVGGSTGLWRWKPDPPILYPAPGPFHSLSSLIEGDNGRLWIAIPDGIDQLVGEKIKTYPLTAPEPFNPPRLLRDRDGGLWIGTTQGIVHLHQGRTDLFTTANGLSDDLVHGLFEDANHGEGGENEFNHEVTLLAEGKLVMGIEKTGELTMIDFPR